MRIYYFDEDRGRKFAIKYGLAIKGVLGVLLQAKEKGLILEINPLIEDYKQK